MVGEIVLSVVELRNTDCGVLETTDWGEVTVEIDWCRCGYGGENAVVMAATPLFVLLEMAVKGTLLEVEAVVFDAAILEPIRVGVLKVCGDIELSDRSDDTLAELEFARGVELVNDVYSLAVLIMEMMRLSSRLLFALRH